MLEGWILLHRKVQECEIWDNSQPFDMRSAWVDLLLLANHKDAKMIFDYEPMTVKRGQYLTSVRKLSARWNWNKDRTLKYLRLLETLGMIHRDSNKQRTLITVEKYGVYQGVQDTNTDTVGDTGTDTAQTQDRHGYGHGADTGTDTGTPQTNNDNNDNNENNDNNDNNEKKYIYGEYRHVRLTEAEKNRLFNDYGEAETLEAIKFLDEYKQRKPYKSKDDNLTLRKWVFRAVQDEKRANKPQNNTQSLAEKWGLGNDA